jgi:hypothetical protein
MPRRGQRGIHVFAMAAWTERGPSLGCADETAQFRHGVGGVLAIPLAARAQPAMPVIGFLHLGSPAPNTNLGFVEGQNVAIDYRWAEGRGDRLAELAAELVRRPVSVIVTLSATQAALAAKVATGTIPIVFQVCQPQPARRQRDGYQLFHL